MPEVRDTVSPVRFVAGEVAHRHVSPSSRSPGLALPNQHAPRVRATTADTARPSSAPRGAPLTPRGALLPHLAVPR
jgi:hypothetical protein